MRGKNILDIVYLLVEIDEFIYTKKYTDFNKIYDYKFLYTPLKLSELCNLPYRTINNFEN